MPKVIRLTKPYVYDEATAGNCKVISDYLLPRSDWSALRAALNAVSPCLPLVSAAVHIKTDEDGRVVSVKVSIYDRNSYDTQDMDLGGLEGVSVYSDRDPVYIAFKSWLTSQGLPRETENENEIVNFFKYFAERIPGFDYYFRIEE